MSKKFSFLAIFMIFAATLSAEGRSWVIDNEHSNLRFITNHMMISEIEGHFEDFYAAVTFDEKEIATTNINVTARVGSINTGNVRRDDHLRSDDFFDADNYPELKFRGRSVQHISGNKFKLIGDMTVKNVTKEIAVDMSYGGMVVDYWGNKRAAIKLEGSFNRFDFGLNWNEVLEAGGLIVGEDVRIHCNLEILQQAGSDDLATTSLSR